MAIFFAAVALTLAFAPILTLQSAIVLALTLLLLGFCAAMIGHLIDRSLELPCNLFGRYLAPLVIAVCLLSQRFIEDALAITPTLLGSSTQTQIALISRSIAHLCAVTSLSVMILMSCVLMLELPARWIAELGGVTNVLPIAALRIMVICAVFFLGGMALTQLLSFELNPLRLLTPP